MSTRAARASMKRDEVLRDLERTAKSRSRGERAPTIERAPWAEARAASPEQ